VTEPRPTSEPRPSDALTEPRATDAPEMPEEEMQEEVEEREPTPLPAPAAPTPTVSPDLGPRQRAFLLQQLADAPEQCLNQGTANRQLIAAVKRELELDNATANELRETLEREGHLRITRGRPFVYELTEKGRTYLATLPAVEVGRTVPATLPEVSEELRQKQHYVLLNQIAEAGGFGLSGAMANRQLGRAVQRELELDTKIANLLRQALAEQDYIEIEKEGRSVTYRLTDAGRAYLATLPVVEISSGRGEGKGEGRKPRIVEVSDEVRKNQQAFLLLEMLRSERESLSLDEISYRSALAKSMFLNRDAAEQLFASLAEQGYVESREVEDEERFVITHEGRLYLGTLQQYESGTFELSGQVLNALLEAARESAKDLHAPGEEGEGEEEIESEPTEEGMRT
jgi:predicted transcriptional regulator